jgi:hypothetical protein
MSFNDRENPKDWEDRLKEFYIKQDDLNRLIMDYLVNGEIFANSQNQIVIFLSLFFQRDLKRLQKSFKKSRASSLM